MKRVALVVFLLAQATLSRARDPGPLPSGAIHRLRVPDDSAVVRSVAFSPDGKMLASAHVRSAVRLWVIATGKEARRLDHVGAVRVCFSPDGKVLASASHDNGVFLWDAATGNKIRTLEHQGAFIVAFSPDGVHMASCALDGKLRLWQAATGKETGVLLSPHRVWDSASVAFSPDGKTVALTTAVDVQVWEVGSGKTIHTLQRQTSAIVFSPFQKMLATAGMADPVRLWDAPSGTPRAVMASEDMITSLAFSPDGKILVSAGHDSALSKRAREPAGTIRLWETVTSKEIAVLRADGSVEAVSFSPDGQTLASGNGEEVLIWAVRPRVAGRASRLTFDDQLWKVDLGYFDARDAYELIWDLVAVPRQTVPYLERHLKPVPLPDERLVRLIEDLDSEQFAVRDNASRELGKLGEAAVPALRARAKDVLPSLEMRRRIERLLNGLDTRRLSPAQLRIVRGVQVLEYIGNKEARELLEKLAAGMPEALLTDEAKAARERLSGRP